MEKSGLAILVSVLLGAAGPASGGGAPPYVGDLVTQPTRLDLLDTVHWQLDGVRRREAGARPALVVRPTRAAIVAKAGPPFLNPPLHLSGALVHSGQVTLDIGLSQLGGGGTISVYGAPPLIEDEFRAELATFRVDLVGRRLRVRLFDQGLRPHSRALIAPLPRLTRHDLTLRFAGSRAVVHLDGRRIGQLDGAGSITRPGRLWLGLSAQHGPGLVVDRLVAAGRDVSWQAARRLSWPSPRQDSLAGLMQAQRPDFYLGAAVAPGPLVADPRYLRRLAGDFSAISVENAGKWQLIHPRRGAGPGSFDFSGMDLLVDLADRHGLRVHGHALIFGEANPAWMDRLESRPALLRQAARDHITAVVGRYRGRVASWDVINEPLADYGERPGPRGLQRHVWLRALGPGYVAEMLRVAHRADPAAELWINDFGLEGDDERFRTMLTLVRRLRADHVPLTGIGFQAHLDEADTIRGGRHIDVRQLRGRFRALAKLGVASRVSELDVTSPRMAAIPSEVVGACLAEPSCEGVTTWGITDRYSSGGSVGRRGRFHPGIGLLWDFGYAETPALRRLRETLNHR